MLSDNFICASHEYSTYTKAVPAPYFRKSFCLDSLPKSCRMTVCGLGFYELYINGRDITKGLCAPYISNPDHLVYYDSYNILPYLTNGKNTVGILLGNGMQNAPGGQIWDFDDANEVMDAHKLPRYILSPETTVLDYVRFIDDYDAKSRRLEGMSVVDVFGL